MSRRVYWPAGLVVALVALCGWCWVSVAGAQAPSRRSAPSGFRKLAPGVETTVPALVDPHDTVMYHNIVELLDEKVDPNLNWTPKYTSPTKTLRAQATDFPFRSTTWYLQFIFKPLRLIEVDLPNDKGRLQRQVVWYLVYRVKNVGGHLEPVKPKPDADPLAGAPEVQAVDSPGTQIRFFPHFTLEADIEGNKKVYDDQVLPLAVEAIRKREDPRRRLFNSAEIGAQEVKLSTAVDDNSVWGVATWVSVDPRIDFFSVYVSGLTNAYRWTDGNDAKAGAAAGGDALTASIAKAAAERRYKHKTLQLNFWRPGDEFVLLEDEIFIGAPSDKVQKAIDPDNPEILADAPKPATATGRDWEKIIDYRWLFR